MGTQRFNTKFNLAWLVITIHGCDNTAETYKQQRANEITQKQYPRQKDKPGGLESSRNKREFNMVETEYRTETERGKGGKGRPIMKDVHLG